MVAADRVADVVDQAGQLKTEIIGIGGPQNMSALQAVSKQIHRITLRRRGVEHPVESGQEISERVDIRASEA